MASVLITGGCGFIGSNLALAFLRQGDAVTCFDNLSRRGSDLLRARVEAQGARFVKGDIRNAEDFDQLAGPFHLMIECSAEPSVLAGTTESGARFMIDNNLMGSVQCFEYARAHRIPVLFLSTSRVYPYDRINALPFTEDTTRVRCQGQGPGIGPAGLSEDFPLGGVRSMYGATKLASELLLVEYSRQFDLPALINRCGVVAGPWQLGKTDQGVFTFWMASHFYGKPLTYIGFGGRGHQVRDVLHIDDLVELMLRQARRIGEFRGEVYNVGGGAASSLSLAETTQLCARISGRTVAVGSSPDTRPADVLWYVTDARRVGEVFGWKPARDGERVLRDIHGWLAQHGEEFRSVLA